MTGDQYVVTVKVTQNVREVVTAPSALVAAEAAAGRVRASLPKGTQATVTVAAVTEFRRKVIEP